MIYGCALICADPFLQNFACLLGSQGGWGYIGGNGQKIHKSPTGINYAAPYGTGDIIGVQLDFEAKTIEFFKNGESLGVAHENLVGPVVAAVSTVGKLARFTLIPATSSNTKVEDASRGKREITAETWKKRLEV